MWVRTWREAGRLVFINPLKGFRGSICISLSPEWGDRCVVSIAVLGCCQNVSKRILFHLQFGAWLFGQWVKPNVNDDLFLTKCFVYSPRRNPKIKRVVRC